LTLHSSFDASACQAMRKKRVADGESKVSINDLIAKAILSALKIHPEMNAHFLGDRLAVFMKFILGSQLILLVD
jgi:pyruvate/2-oxoglutarate dehydrogenase complex dihydrolipoamide acyltransferase (E2) component